MDSNQISSELDQLDAFLQSRLPSTSTSDPAASSGFLLPLLQRLRGLEGSQIPLRLCSYHARKSTFSNMPRYPQRTPNLLQEVFYFHISEINKNGSTVEEYSDEKDTLEKV